MNTLDIASVTAAFALAFSTGAIAQSMSKADYKSGKGSIAAEYKSATAACASVSGNARDKCADTQLYPVILEYTLLHRLSVWNIPNLIEVQFLRSVPWELEEDGTEPKRSPSSRLEISSPD